MDGILKFMGDNMKNIKCIFAFVITLISPVSAGDDVIRNEVVSKNDTRSAALERTANIKILTNSVVIRDESNLVKSSPGASRVGTFIYEETPNKLSEKLLDSQTQSLNSLGYKTDYRLVEIPGKRNLITDGSFVVFFKTPEDKQQFNIDYSLVPKFEMPDANTYKSKNFEDLQSLLDTLRNDARVKLVELDLIDPSIVPQ